jgi:hypothetical protein
MAAELMLQGSLFYPDERALRRCLVAARDRLDEAHPEAAVVVRAEWKRFFEQEGLSLQVEIALVDSADNLAAIDLLATDLTGRANAGELEISGPDRDPRSYPAALDYDDDDG